MVFNPPTSLNYSNADMYSYERQKIQQYNYHLKFRPEIMSHNYIEISYNTELEDNQDIPWYRKIRFIVRARKQFCSQATCQNHFPRGNTCSQTDVPRVFKTGDHDVEACQPSCFNLYEGAKMPKDDSSTTTQDEEFARAPFLIYSHRQCACTIHNNGIFALGIDDFARTDKHPLPRIDTIGTGFHYIDSGNFFDRENFSVDDNPPFVDISNDESFRFRVNKYYCDDFQLKFDGKKCYSSLGEQIFGFLVSSSLYKACQYGVRYATTGVTNTDVQKLDLPPVKYSPRHDTVASWKNDVDDTAFFIDPNVSLTDLGFTEDMKHCIFTTQYGYPGTIVEPLASNKNVTGNVIDYEALNKDRLYQFRYDINTGRRLIDEYEIYGIYKYIRSNPTKSEFSSDKYQNPDHGLASIIDGIIDNFGEVSAILTFNYLFEKGLEYSKKLLQLSSEYINGTITPTLLHIVERQFLTQSLHPTIRIFSQVISNILKTSTSFIKMADVFTTVAGIIDLFDMTFDFFNMNNVMDDGSVRQYSELDIKLVRDAYGYGTVEFSPVTFMLMCEYLKLPDTWSSVPSATTKLRCIKEYPNHKYMIPISAVIRYDTDNDNSYEWVSEYIFSLKVNSNGLKINWEDESKLSSETINKYINIDENVYLRGMERYAQYTESFRTRVKYSQYTLVALFIVLILIVVVYIKLAVPFLLIAAISAGYIAFSYLLGKN